MSKSHEPPLQPTENVQANRELNRVVIGDRAIGVFSEADGEMELSEVNEDQGWIEFSGDHGCIAISLEKIRTESLGGEVDE